jgi:hypothetical protein
MKVIKVNTRDNRYSGIKEEEQSQTVSPIQIRYTEPTFFGERKPIKNKRVSKRALGTNPRALGTNPRSANNN